MHGILDESGRFRRGVCTPGKMRVPTWIMGHTNTALVVRKARGTRAHGERRKECRDCHPTVREARLSQ